MNLFWLKVSDDFYGSMENAEAAVTTSLRLLQTLEEAVAEDIPNHATGEMLVRETRDLFQRVSNYYLGNW